MKKFLVTMLAALMVTSMVACGGKNEPAKTADPAKTQEAQKSEEPVKVYKYDTLVLSTSLPDGVFNQFFATSAYDTTIIDLTAASLWKANRNAEVVDGLAEYAVPEEVIGADGEVEKTIYTFKLKDGVKFSDGSPITADDIIFTYKVYSDPNYDGSATLYTLPIVGMQDYRYDSHDYEAKIAEIKAEADKKYAADKISKEDYIQFLIDTNIDGWYESLDQDVDGAGMTWKDYITREGFKVDDATLADETALIALIAEVEYTKYASGYDPYTYYYDKMVSEYVNNNLQTGTDHVEDIAGIVKIDDQTVQVTMNGVDAAAVWKLAIAPVQQSYYGVNFKKGDMSTLKALNNMPKGAGPYIFESYENNVVTLRANENYYLGKPKIPTIKYQVTNSGSILEEVIMGTFDIGDPAANPDNKKTAEEAGLHVETIDNLGYGYIGINADRITDKNVRKGLMHLMNRAPAVETYYGDLASVIERPMSRVSWAYDPNAKEYYGYNPEKALEYFKTAGYEQVDGKLVKDGEQLVVEVYIGGSGNMEHPSAPILTQMKTDMNNMGAELNIRDVDSTTLFAAMNAGTADMWVAAWSSTIDPDMYQVYYSTGPSNHYHVKNAELDKLILEARKTNDIEKRKPLYYQALDILMDEAVEMPVYQRMNMYVFNQEHINIDTLPADMTPYYEYFAEIETLELY